MFELCETFIRSAKNKQTFFFLLIVFILQYEIERERERESLKTGSQIDNADGHSVGQSDANLRKRIYMSVFFVIFSQFC